MQELMTKLIQCQSNSIQPIRFLRDPDFRLNAQPGLNGNEFFWSLPSIESYLFLYHCEKTVLDNSLPSPLIFLHDEDMQKLFATDYANGFRSQNQNPDDLWLMFKNWNEALESAKNPNPTTKDFVAVAKVIRGRTWVKEVMQSTTPKLITDVNANITKYCPDLKELLHKLITF